MLYSARLETEAKETDSLRKHGHSNLKASQTEVDGRQVFYRLAKWRSLREKVFCGVIDSGVCRSVGNRVGGEFFQRRADNALGVQSCYTNG